MLYNNNMCVQSFAQYNCLKLQMYTTFYTYMKSFTYKYSCTIYICMYVYMYVLWIFSDFTIKKRFLHHSQINKRFEARMSINGTTLNIFN